MSNFFKKNNKESTALLFNKRVVYESTSNNDKYKNLVNFRAEKILYGRVDRNFVPMIIPENSSKIKYFSSRATNSQGFKALNFVVDAFNDLQQQFKKSLLLSKIDPNDPYLSNLKIYKAYESPFLLYEKYISRYNIIIKNSNNMNSNKLENFDMLSNNLLLTLNNAAKTNPLTFTAFIKSRKTPISISGLAIEISDLDYTNDEEKVNNFISSKNWNFYLNACRSYGFMVDLNNPWRLIADIGSQPMIEYASKYGYTDTNSILFNYYRKASFVYYNSFISRMYDMYNFFKPVSIIKLSDCKGNTILNNIIPDSYKSIEKLKESYGQDNFLMLYCKLRFSEEESQYTEQEKNTILRDTLQLSKSKGANVAIEQFEIFLNETLDYQGSLGYYIEKSRAGEEQEDFTRTSTSQQSTATTTTTTTTTTQTTGY